jgi:hypothetical protein
MHHADWLTGCKTSSLTAALQYFGWLTEEPPGNVAYRLGKKIEWMRELRVCCLKRIRDPLSLSRPVRLLAARTRCPVG